MTQVAAPPGREPRMLLKTIGAVIRPIVTRRLDGLSGGKPPGIA
jgi:hypothetical protein